MLESPSSPYNDPQSIAPLEQLFIQCPCCPFHAATPFQLRKHAMFSHVACGSNKTSTLSPPLQKFSCEFYMCAVCGLSSSDDDKIKEHFKLRHQAALDLNSPVAILQQKFVLSPCSTGSSLLDADSDTDMPESTASIFTADGNFTSKFHLPLATDAFSNFPLAPISSYRSNWSTPTDSTLSLTTSNSTMHSSVPMVDLSVRNSITSPAKLESFTPLGLSSRNASQVWSQLIARSDKKFVCLICRRYIYSGRTEVVFHSVTRHLLAKEIESDLSHYGRLTDHLKRRIGHNFAEGMRIRSGVHYKDAKRVEAALFRSIELHLRYRPIDCDPSDLERVRYHCCSGCGATFTELQAAYVHVNEELRSFLPDFMRARSCPWSLSTRDEWVWRVPDLPIQPLPSKSMRVGSFPSSSVGSESGITESWMTRSAMPSVTSEATAAVEAVKSLVAAAGFLRHANLNAKTTDQSHNAPVKSEPVSTSEEFISKS